MTCEGCGGEQVRIETMNLFGLLLYVCACWKAYPRSKMGWAGRSTAYCVNLECECQPAGQSRAYGALTGRARWSLSRSTEQAPGTEVTLCGGCYRRVRHVVPVGDPLEVLAAHPSYSWL